MSWETRKHTLNWFDCKLLTDPPTVIELLKTKITSWKKTQEFFTFVCYQHCFSSIWHKKKWVFTDQVVLLMFFSKVGLNNFAIFANIHYLISWTLWRIQTFYVKWSSINFKRCLLTFKELLRFFIRGKL